jgi:hypothetical protein
MGDWYRKTSWLTADSEDFERRLARARRENRAQYLRIQAVHLFQTGAKDLIGAAATLATRVTTEYDDDIQTGQAHHLLGQCHEAAGDVSAALAEFRKAVDWERTMPFVQTDAYLDFAWLVARRGAVEHFPEALDFLTRFRARQVFPVQRYRYQGALALMPAQHLMRPRKLARPSGFTVDWVFSIQRRTTCVTSCSASPNERSLPNKPLKTAVRHRDLHRLPLARGEVPRASSSPADLRVS